MYNNQKEQRRKWRNSDHDNDKEANSQGCCLTKFPRILIVVKLA